MTQRYSSYTASELTGAGAEWIKSSHSDGSGNNCVEVAEVAFGVAVRDSKDPDGPFLAFSPDAWRAFSAAVSQGALTGP
jgi:hypothetical protein